jgi:16S rRNA (guanine1207-N2)-methyltransferase
MVEHYFTERPSSLPKKGLLKCILRGYEFAFLTASGVFSRRRIDAGTRFLIESMILPDEGSALDIGCGYGPIGITVAKLRPLLQVWMTDINRRAVALTRKNSRRNGVENVQVIHGSLYEPVKNLIFDTILTNPPISAGIGKVVEPIIMGAFEHLDHGGSLQLVVKSNKSGRTLSAIMEKKFGNFEIIARGGGYRVLMAEHRRKGIE